MFAVQWLKYIGYQVRLENDEIKLTWEGNGLPDPNLVRPFLEKLKKHKAEAIEYLINDPKPCLDENGDLVIPFDSDSKYHWWAGGQSVKDTLHEILEEQIVERKDG